MDFNDIDNLQLKLAENHFLIKAFAENSLVDLQQFAVLRRARARIIGGAILPELEAETVHGHAEYLRLIELNATSRASFMQAAEAHMVALRNPHNLLQAALLAVSSGCLLCLAAMQAGLDFALTDKLLFYEIDFGKTPVEVLLQSLSETG